MTAEATQAQVAALKAITKAKAKHADEDGFVSLLALKGVREDTLQALVGAGAIEARDDGSAALWVRLTSEGEAVIA